MSHIVIIEIKKDGAKFADLQEAVAAFKVDHATLVAVSETDDYNSSLEVTGDLKQSQSLNTTNDGFVVTRTWTDERWASFNGDDSRPELAEGWTRIVK